MERLNLAHDGTLERHVRAFQEDVEGWKDDHADAMACYDLEEILRVGVSLYDLIDRRDEYWRLALARGKFSYSKKFDDEIQELFDLWLNACKRVEGFIAALEAKNYVVDGANEFRERFKKADAAKRDL
jgi:hypothetical protein